ncbi:MAG: Cna B-type domain-containing protein, partial [Clostridia bacterium]|nr:Cna B-type domain-containing protein [Clostridia bacterium]
ECTRDSANNGENGKYSDFLPFNSPYVNSNGKRINTYTYDGDDGRYAGTTHYMYDAKYNTDNNSPDYVGTNYFFGISLDVDFYLPNKPGTIVADGKYGNQDIYGKDMHFHFAGDDDVWIFIDGKMVLDLGGLHGKESGDINFSTGTVSLNGVEQTAFSNVLKNLDAGEHQLTLYYLERGSSLSNCAIYFNLAPRFEFSIQKEDVLTRDVLNGAQFSVFTDAACTIPAELWTSKQAHDNDEPSTNVFTVTDGVAHMWGMGSGNRYYIKETKPPDNSDYGYPNGIICLTFDSDGTANYNVEIIEDENGVSAGFIVHGFRIDTETQQAYIIATNAPKWAKETTTVEAIKKWNDTVDHTNQSVAVYLTVTDSEGNVTRLQEATLNADNNWSVKWENLPKYNEDKTLVKYGVEESYVSGYYSSVEQATGQFEVVTSEWRTAATFENGKTYLLKNSSGQCLSTLQQAEDTGYKWVSTEEATSSQLAMWTATVSGSRVRFTNKAGQTITFWYGNGSPTDFFALNQQLEDNNRKQYFTYTKNTNGFTFRYNNNYLSSSLNSSQKFTYTTRSNQALLITPYTEIKTTTTKPIENLGFVVTNTPLEKETAVTVHKQWVVPPDMNETVYEREEITVKLFANGVDTGRSVELSLKNNWSATFKGLAFEDSNGNAIRYSVTEIIDSDKWVVTYGDVVASDEAVPNYSTTVINTYRTGGPILPATGSYGRLMFILCGLGIMLGSLIYGIIYRCKRERRRK